ncbi:MULTISPECIES: replication-associated recombination protein A [unclassified Gordonia (in: high G+C Gram-positive bacteria)]|uniref:replication-associated recombination protein A n=1 Tax=unclassified Gordonia (in: high G+C Gram-positive bacteria) TaxID=2657482 RepID=UPI0009ADAE8D|nr:MULTISPECIES: replication-associated recombination protein A [unclassified Gordonia (in: high G+C Gram-positive bacteria)]MDF3281726.1 replication-associated recombination protein A [Gordonia sp. N1V]OPX15524.1 AAA family ATPase [Gordonia sp. i37]
MNGLFDTPDPASPSSGPPVGVSAPLAVRMRPRSLDEIIGQTHLLGSGSPLRRLINGSGAASVLLYGPPGTGKTTMASLISTAAGGRFEALSALSAGVKEVRAVIEVARRRLVDGEQTVLFIDEVHRFSKTQQDALLDAVENRIVLLVAATTENPSFSVVSPLLSRSLVLRLRSLTDDDIREVLRRAVTDERGLGGAVRVTDAAYDHLVAVAGGDARRALTALEAAADVVSQDRSDPDAQGDASEIPAVDLADVEAAIDKAAVRYDRDGDQHYDVTSAFIKSIRGSDVDAALHYLARMIAAGEDPRFIARRLMIHASEDIGMADPMALQTAVAAAQVVALVGMPEAKLALTQATIHLATAPKSAGVVGAIGAALADVEAGKAGAVPPHLRDSHYAGAKKMGSGVGYRYPHDDPDGVVPQQYPPDELVGVDYYQPTDHGFEREIGPRVGKLRSIIRRATSKRR